MKLTIFLIFAGLMTVSATIYSQSTKLTVELDNVSLLDLFKQVEELQQPQKKELKGKVVASQMATNVQYWIHSF